MCCCSVVILDPVRNVRAFVSYVFLTCELCKEQHENGVCVSASYGLILHSLGSETKKA